MTRHGQVVWTELNTFEPDKAAAFFEATLGWKVEKQTMADGMIYRVAKIGERTVAGIFTMVSPQFDGFPSHWMSYFEVDDIDATCKAVTAAGGAVKHGPFDVTGVGRIAIVQEPTGGVCGYMTSAPMPG